METKPGWKTSEFSMTWLMGLVAGGFGLQDPEPIVRMGAVLALGLIGAGYNFSRGRAKNGGAK